jgi:hypothetical protein
VSVLFFLRYIAHVYLKLNVLSLAKVEIPNLGSSMGWKIAN